MGVLLFLTIGALSLKLAHEDATTADLQLLARRIEQGDPISTSALATVVDEDSQLLVQQTCRSSIQRAAVTLHLAYLQQHDQNLDYTDWSVAAAAADAITAHAVRCMPGEGNVWVRHAMVQQQIAERPAMLSALLNMSAKLSPADIAPITARLSVWQRVSEQTLTLSRIEIADSLGTFLNFARGHDVRRLLKFHSSAFGELLLDAVGNLPEPRQHEVRLLLPDATAQLESSSTQTGLPTP
jgi:hypothetical protein